MFGGNKQKQQAKRNSDIDSLIGSQTRVRGDIHFSGGLHIDGVVQGNVIAETEHSTVTTSERCRIEGDVRVHHIVLNGEVIGDVHALEHVELAANARVTGNVYYRVIEMMMGAEVNGSLIHVVDTKEEKAQPNEASTTSSEPEELPSVAGANK
jgi:cytoskeletal protein CcmA (bactofilin family)